MISDPGLIHYACIAKGTTVLAEFNSKAAALGAIAAKCLENTPSFHATFSHTVRSKTYTFLIDEPFVYFVISDEKLENSEGLAFLKSLRDAFVKDFNSKKNLENLSSHCFQGEFNPVFRQMVGPAVYHMDGFESPVGQRIGDCETYQSGSGPIRGRPKPGGDKGLYKIKNKLVEELKIGAKIESDENGVIGIGMSHEFSPVVNKNRGLYSGELTAHQKAKKVWKKQACIVLSLDLIACVILFGVWLWVCSGLKCLES